MGYTDPRSVPPFPGAKEVSFPNHPVFELRHLLFAISPETVQDLFYQTKLTEILQEKSECVLCAEGDFCLFAEREQDFDPGNSNHINRHLQKAIEIFRLFTENGGKRI